MSKPRRLRQGSGAARTPPREPKGRGVAWTVFSHGPTPGATKERREKASRQERPEASGKGTS